MNRTASMPYSPERLLVGRNDYCSSISHLGSSPFEPHSRSSIKMNGTASMPYSPLTETRSLFNNPKLSDVRFAVDGQTVYGHKLILAMGSPVFERMFFGELKEKREVIEIKDMSSVDFMNAIKYIYGFPIDYELADLYGSYLAGDKYLLHRFDRAFFDYVKGKLTTKNSCLIYDQLVKIGERKEISLADVRTMIISNSMETLESEHFPKIEQETLISLLSLDQLNVAEVNLLLAVSNWVDCEVQRQELPVNGENRRRVFQSIKPYILFTALKPKAIADNNQIEELLTSEERGALVLHLLNKRNPSPIEQKTARRAGPRTSNNADFYYGFEEDFNQFVGVKKEQSFQGMHW